MKSKFCYLAIVVFLITSSSFAQNFSLLTTFNDNKEGSKPSEFITIGAITYFTVKNSVNNTDELWKTDGSATGTVLVKSYPLSSTGIFYLTDLDGTLVFAANDGIVGAELWKTDGTTAGTVLIKDVATGPTSGIRISANNPRMYKPLAIYDILYFIGAEATTGFEVWKTDGTEAGTVLIRDVLPGSASYAFIGFLTNVGNFPRYVENANDGTGFHIWRTTGTAASTSKVTLGTMSIIPNNLINFNGNLYFSDNSAPGLYMSNGVSGHSLISSVNVSSDLFTTSNNIFFTSNFSNLGLELCKSNGTSGGTSIVKDINTGISSSSPLNLTAIGSTLYFTAIEPTSGRELWKTDGTLNGTVIVKDIFPGSSSSTLTSEFSQTLYNANGTLYFSAEDGINGVELWKTDGTEIGTVLVKNISSNKSSNPLNISYGANGNIFFSATDGVTGFELWKTNGTELGTTLIKDIIVNNDPFETSLVNPNVSTLIDVNGTTYFSGFERQFGGELYKTNGTIVGTSLIKDIHSSSNSSNPSEYVNINGTIFFTAQTELGRELWKTDGTEAGTMLVKDIYPGFNSSNPNNLIRVGNTLFFAADNGTVGQELWKSDGTTAGTVLVKDIYPGAVGRGIFSPKVLNNKLIFGTSEPTFGQELWVSDGTAAGTTLLKDIYLPGGPDASSAGFWSGLEPLVVNGVMYFAGTTNATGIELWKTDGTETGTVLVKDINSGAANSVPRNFTNLNGTIFFQASSAANGLELWKTDGTETGTVLVKDINSGVNSSNPLNLVALNNSLLFTSNNGINGVELWKTDGTENGTVLIKDINPGLNSANVFSLLKVGNQVYFYANDSTSSSYSLWKTDGTENGTIKVTDFAIGGNSITSGNLLFLSGSNLYAIARTKLEGTQLWVANVSSILPVQILDFSATNLGKEILLKWEVTNEVNLMHYNIQRSIDGQTFENIGTVKAVGNKIYNFSDNNLPNGVDKLYYRLEAADKDMSKQYSQTVAVKWSKKNNTIKIYPNPAKSKIYVNADNMKYIEITNVIGNKIISQSVLTGNVESVDISSLIKGVYYLSVVSHDGSIFVQKLFVE